MTGVGALLLSGFSKVSTPWHLATYSLTAAGMMSGCSLVILGEAWHGGYVAMGVGFLAGLLAMWLLELLPCEELSVGEVNLKGERARKVVVLMASLLVHSAGEGLCIGASAAATDRPAVGHLVLASLALHNVPEGLAVTMAFMSRGLPWKTSAFLAVLCNLGQPIVSAVAYGNLVGSTAVHMGLAFAAACMLSIVCTDLVPEALEKEAMPKHAAAALVGVSCAVIMSTDALAHLYIPER